MAPPQWAYQVENYITEPDDELICSVCRAVFCEPTLCPCDHVYCKECISKWLQNSRNCPVCRKRVYNSSIRRNVPIIKNLIMKLIINCHNKSLGCKAQFSVESSEAHVKECEYEFVQCQNIPCTDKLFRKDIVEHEKKDCPHRYQQCEKCKCKIPSSAKKIEKHSCIKSLHNLVKEKKDIIQKQKDHIKKLEKEIETLKGTLQEADQSRMPGVSHGRSLTSSTLSRYADQFTINIHGFDTQSSISSDSDVSSDNFYVLTEDPLPDGNEDSDAISVYLARETDVETENVARGYRNADTQTNLYPTVSPLPHDLDYATDNSGIIVSETFEIVDNNSGELISCNNSEVISRTHNNLVAPSSPGFDESEELSQRRQPTKRRPTTEKPAKRRFRAVTPYTSDDDDDTQLPSRLSKSWHLVNTKKNKVTEVGRRKHVDSYMEAGPSSASAPASSSGTAVPGNPEICPLSRSKQKRAKQAESYVGNNAASSRVSVNSGNPVFERTLALLEQYNLESDPEWLPQYASHTGNTTTESDSSDLVESSNSELSDADEADSLENNSVILDGSQHELPAISDFMNWMFDSTSEDDPDWRPPVYEDDEMQ